MIDEAQAVSLDAPNAHPDTLASLHQGITSLHMSFCAFGLPGTIAALAKANVSRYSQRHDIHLRGLDDKAYFRRSERFRWFGRSGWPWVSGWANWFLGCRWSR